MSGNQQFLEKKSDRRGILALGLAVVVGGLAALAGRPQRTRAHHGELNVATASESSPAIHAENTANGSGVEGTSDGGPGVRGPLPDGGSGEAEMNLQRAGLALRLVSRLEKGNGSWYVIKHVGA